MAGSELGAGTKIDDHRWLVRRREGAPPRLQLDAEPERGEAQEHQAQL
jgi:hypothetical protein